MVNESLWMKDQIKNNFPALKQDIDVDILIIGGGITGMMIAYFLKDSDKKIALVEANQIGCGVTSKTTGKITYLQETIYSDIATYKNIETAYQYYNAQKEAISQITKIIKEENISCNLEQVESFVIAHNKKEEKKVRKEKEILEKFGCPVNEQFIKNHYAISVEDTYVFHPLKYLDALTNRIKDTINIFENTIIHKLTQEQKKVSAHSDKGVIRASKVVLANHYPFFLIPFLFPLKTRTEKSYILAQKVDFYEPKSFITSNFPYTSVRFHRDEDTYLIYLGESHNLCNHLNEKENKKNLLKKANRFIKNPHYYWENDDVMTVDSIPFIGRVQKNNHTLYIATGYNTWGMTNSVVAGFLIRDLLMEKQSDYENLYAPFRKKGWQYIKEYIKIIGSNTKSFLENKLIKKKKWYPNHVHITKKEGKDIAIVHDENGEHIVYTKCPHMGCNLLYNEIEKIWECPCHASYFNLDGKCIKGPSSYDISFKE